MMYRWLKILVLLGLLGVSLPFVAAETPVDTWNESTTVLFSCSSSGASSCTQCLEIGNTSAPDDCGTLLSTPANDTDLEAYMEELIAIQASIEEKGLNWHAEMNSISRLPPEQRAALLGARLQAGSSGMPSSRIAGSSPGETTAYPATLDWRDNGGDWTTPVKNQARCGSCYAFATVGAYESRLELAMNDPDLNPDFSEQEIVSCSRCGGCAGAYMTCPMNWALSPGMVEESCFPYASASYTVPCTVCTNPERFKPDDWVPLWNEDEATIKDALLRGPIVGTFLVYDDFYSYGTGVYEYSYGDLRGGHAIVLVGWGEDDRGTYWIAKNSWGPYWGESGYFRIRSGTCAINDELYEIVVNPVPYSSDGIAVFRSAESINWKFDAYMNGFEGYSDHYGLSTDIPLMNDFNNDGTIDRAVFRNGEWIYDYDVDGTVDARDKYGMTGDVPFSGDFNNDGIMDRGVFRNGEWIFDYSLDRSVNSRSWWGMAGDIPLTGDFNGDSIMDRAVFRGWTYNNWIFDYSIDTTSDFREHYGMSGDAPLAGDFNRDGSIDRAVFRSGWWIIDYGMDVSVDQRFQFGIPGDKSVLWSI